MNKVEKIISKIEAYFDTSVAQLGQEDYREVLENVISDLESKLDCVKEEMQAEGID